MTQPTDSRQLLHAVESGAAPQFGAQQRLLEMIAMRRPLPLVLDELARTLETACPGARASVLLLDEGLGVLRVATAPSMPPEFREGLDGVALDAEAGPCASAVRDGRECVVDLLQHPDAGAFERLGRDHGLQSCWLTPITHTGGTVLGALALCHQARYEPTANDRLSVSRARHLASIAIEHDRAEGALRESEARSSAVVTAALDCIIVMDQHGYVREFNPAAERTFGYTRTEAIGHTLAELIVPPSLRDAHNRGLRHYLATGEGPVLGTRLELPAMRRDGTELPVELSILPITTGTAPHFVGYMRDLTERKRSEQEREENARITALSSEVGAAVTEGGPVPTMLQRCAEAVVKYLDAAFARVWTLNEAEQVLELQASAGMYLHLDGPHGRVPVGQYKIGLIASERMPHLTNSVQDDPRIGDPEWARREGMVAFAGYPLIVEDRLYGVVALFARRPLSDRILEALRLVAERLSLSIQRRETEQRMQQSEQRHRTLVEATAAVVWRTSADGQFAGDQPRWRAFTGQSAAEAAGEGWLSAVHADDRGRTRADWSDAVRARSLFQSEHRLRRHDGEYRLMQARAVPIGGTGEVVEWMGVHTDLTEQRRAQAARQQLEVEQVARREAEAGRARLRTYSEELERSNQELQAFAYVASHDLQEPLRKIRAFGDVLLADYGDQLGQEGGEFLRRMQNAAERMQTLINDLLAFSRVSSNAQPFRPVDLNIVARDVLDTLELRIRETGATVRVDPLPTVHADPVQMNQLLQNLLGNALKFVRPGSRPSINVSADGVIDPADGREWTELKVADDGIGFDERYLDRIFTIFQRLHTRSGFDGTGVGLAICRKIAERHGGTITARSAPDRGATFIVRLPARPSSSPTPP